MSSIEHELTESKFIRVQIQNLHITSQIVNKINCHFLFQICVGIVFSKSYSQFKFSLISHDIIDFLTIA